MNIIQLHIFAFASHGVGISGGDRIWIELVRRWQQKFPIAIETWKEGKEMAERQSLKENTGLRFNIYELGFFCNLGFVLCYFARIFKGIWVGLTLKIENNSSTYIYNASEFWMDAFPCILIKMRYPKITWVAAWYQTAPNPLKGFSEKTRSGQTYKLRAFAYWITQLPIKPLIKKYANYVIVNNEDEKKQFPEFAKNNKAIVMIGAVPLDEIINYQKRQKTKSKKQFDAVFQGRFHAQKGVEELIDIWKQVVNVIPNAKLAMIGNGPLMESVIKKIKILHLDKNVKLFGFVFDGPEKYKIFSESKMVLHPAYYDSGGMATAEAMAFGIPAVGFDLKAYNSYYPRGMIKAKDENEFAQNILRLLQYDDYRDKIGKEAYNLIHTHYSWDSRANEILKKIKS
jgi:glycosyltransferase involved in cell wall biosynthesis